MHGKGRGRAVRCISQVHYLLRSAIIQRNASYRSISRGSWTLQRFARSHEIKPIGSLHGLVPLSLRLLPDRAIHTQGDLSVNRTCWRFASLALDHSGRLPIRPLRICVSGQGY
jgi:hypothetical protein